MSITLQRLKDALIEHCKAHFAKLESDQYPAQKQVDASLGITADKTTIKDAIIALRADCDAAVTEIGLLATTTVYDDFTSGTETENRTYVSGKMTGLTTDDQKNAIWCGLMNIESDEAINSFPTWQQ